MRNSTLDSNKTLYELKSLRKYSGSKILESFSYPNDSIGQKPIDQYIYYYNGALNEVYHYDLISGEINRINKVKLSQTEKH